MSYWKIFGSRISDDGRGGAIVVLLSGSVVLLLCTAFIYRVFFDRVIPERNVAMAFWVMAFLILVEFLGVVANFLTGMGLARVCRVRTRNERRRFNERIWCINPGWFNVQGVGAIVRHFEDTAVLGRLRQLFLKDVLRPFFLLMILLPAMFFMEPLLALGRVVCVLPSLFAGWVFLGRDLVLERDIWQMRRLVTTELQRGVRGLSVLKTGRGGEGFRRLMSGRFYGLGEGEFRRATLGVWWEASAGAVERIGSALNMGLVVYLVMAGRLSFGAYIAFSIISGRCMWAISHLFQGLRGMGVAENALRRQRYLFSQDYDGGMSGESEAESVECEGAGGGRDRKRPGGGEPEKNVVECEGAGGGSGLFIPRFHKGLEVRRLCFSYLTGRVVLDNISLDVAPEERVWLKGGSGSGKSTFMGILLGLYRPDSGGLSFAGVNLLDCSIEMRRTLVGAVFQEAVFFDGTVRENLSIYDPAPSDSVLWEALEKASVRGLVESFPEGLGTAISGEYGRLSGGEKQKLALARLLVVKPPLIILDEPLNALDSSSADMLRGSLDSACRGSAVIAISHDSIPPIRIHRSLRLEEGSGGEDYVPGA